VGARSGVGLRLRLHHSSPLARPRLPPNPQIKKESEWYNFIKELDRQRARGVQAVESPLLWDDAELESLLKGAAA
jgi:hypothetical protein